MRVSNRVDYGVRALYDLACHGGSGPVQSRDIARRQGLPEPYLRQLLGALGRGGLVRSTRGPQGGHRLTRSPDAVTLLDIWQVLEGRDPPRDRRAAPGARTPSARSGTRSRAISMGSYEPSRSRP